VNVPHDVSWFASKLSHFTRRVADGLPTLASDGTQASLDERVVVGRDVSSERPIAKLADYGSGIPYAFDALRYGPLEALPADDAFDRRERSLETRTRESGLVERIRLNHLALLKRLRCFFHQPQPRRHAGRGRRAAPNECPDIGTID
jgi:hypothetical protein